MSDNVGDDDGMSNEQRAAQARAAEGAITALARIKWEAGGAQLSTMEDTWRLAQIVAQSRAYPGLNTAAQAMMKFAKGAELGFSPIASLDIHIIEGKASLPGEMMLAKILSRGDIRHRFIQNDALACVIEWRRKFADEAEAGWQIVGQSSFTIEQAKQAGLVQNTRNDKPSNWIKYPEDMLCWRAVSRAKRKLFPDLFMGIAYVDGEVDVEMERNDRGDWQAKPHENGTPSDGSGETAPKKKRASGSDRLREQMKEAEIVTTTATVQPGEVESSAAAPTSTTASGSTVAQPEPSGAPPTAPPTVDTKSASSPASPPSDGPPAATPTPTTSGSATPPQVAATKAPAGSPSSVSIADVEKAAAPSVSPTKSAAKLPKPSAPPTSANPAYAPAEGERGLDAALRKMPRDESNLTNHMHLWQGLVDEGDRQTLKFAVRRAYNLATGGLAWSGFSPEPKAKVIAAYAAIGSTVEG